MRLGLLVILCIASVAKAGNPPDGWPLAFDAACNNNSNWQFHYDAYGVWDFTADLYYVSSLNGVGTLDVHAGTVSFGVPVGGATPFYGTATADSPRAFLGVAAGGGAAIRIGRLDDGSSWSVWRISTLFLTGFSVAGCIQVFCEILGGFMGSAARSVRDIAS